MCSGIRQVHTGSDQQPRGHPQQAQQQQRQQREQQPERGEHGLLGGGDILNWCAHVVFPFFW